MEIKGFVEVLVDEVDIEQATLNYMSKQMPIFYVIQAALDHVDMVPFLMMLRRKLHTIEFHKSDKVAGAENKHNVSFYIRKKTAKELLEIAPQSRGGFAQVEAGKIAV